MTQQGKQKQTYQIQSFAASHNLVKRLNQTVKDSGIKKSAIIRAAIEAYLSQNLRPPSPPALITQN